MSSSPSPHASPRVSLDLGAVPLLLAAAWMFEVQLPHDSLLQSHELPRGGPRSRNHIARITTHDRFCYASEYGPPVQLPSCFMRLCRCLYAAFQTSLNVARNASARRRRIPKTLGFLSAGKHPFSICPLRYDGERNQRLRIRGHDNEHDENRDPGRDDRQGHFHNHDDIDGRGESGNPHSPGPPLRLNCSGKGNGIASKAYPMGQIPPQNLPALAPARSLRPRVTHAPMATPVEVRSLSELRWRRFSRLQGR